MPILFVLLTPETGHIRCFCVSCQSHPRFVYSPEAMRRVAVLYKSDIGLFSYESDGLNRKRIEGHTLVGDV